MTIYISDNADEFRIEISGRFSASAAADAAFAWKAALMANTPRRISIDITGMNSYDEAGYLMLREAHAHGTHFGAGTPKALQFLAEISSPIPLQFSQHAAGNRGTLPTTMQPRAIASGE